MASYHIWTLGCQMNQADSLKLAAGLDRLGFEAAPSDAEADLVVINTCSVRQHAEDRAYSRLGVLAKRKRRGERFTLAVMGCMVGPRTEVLARRFPFVDAWARPQQFDPILEAARSAGALDPLTLRDVSEGEFWPSTYGRPEGPTAYVPVVHGCDKMCTYCIVPLRRGRERSRPVAEVLGEVSYLAERGVREVTLVGQTVEAYGNDLEPGAGARARPDLATLFEGIERVEGIDRIRFLTSYPRDMTDRIVEAVADLPRVCEHFNIPVQSGSDSMLARMRRGYTVSQFEERVARIRECMPHASLATDVIVGCPGETEGEFRATVELLERTRFNVIHAAAYSPRPGTYASRKMEDDVPREVKRERLQVIERLHAASAAHHNQPLLGSRLEVLVEREKEGRSSGRARGGQLVHFDGTGLVGQLVEVDVDEVSPWSLQGRRADDLTLAVL